MSMAVVPVASWLTLCALAFAGIAISGVPVASTSPSGSSFMSPIVGFATIAYAQDPPPLAHTGGFGEPTCQECHFGSPLDPPGGSLAIEVAGVGGEGERPDDGGFDPDDPDEEDGRGGEDREMGETARRIRVVLRREEMERAGFQLAVRFAAGPEAGEQAGTLRPVDDRVSVTTDPRTGVQYAQHSRDGTALSSPGVAVWQLEWMPPPAGGESDAADRSGPRDDSGATDACGTKDMPAELVFHVAANAANYDDSEFGDLVYTAEEILDVLEPLRHAGDVAVELQ